jgi:hypothetical protein
MLSLWGLIHLPSVQTWLVGRVTSRLSHDLHTRISVRHVNFSLFNKMLLDSTLVEDSKADTLLFAGTVKVNITDWWFFKDKAQLQYIGLEDATVKLQRTDSIWNYQFLVDYFTDTDTTLKKVKDTVKGLQLDLHEVELSRIHFLKHDAWRGEDMDLRLKALSLDADTIDLTDKRARINHLDFTRPEFVLSNYAGRRPHPPIDTVPIVNDPLHLRLNPAGWDLTAGRISIRDGSFRNEKIGDTIVNKYFDGNHIHFYEINTSFANLRLNRDTITAQLALSTKERSGLEVKKLNARIKWFPEGMEFARLDLQTNKSRLHNFFAMRFKTLDDMGDFETKIRMEGDFNDSEIETDDIAWFAPELKDWSKRIHITGNLQGTVADLHGRKVILAAGKNTLLNGDIHIKGLPDFEKAYIEFKSNDFRTTYEDMVTLVPSLRQVQQPRLDRVEWLRFKGEFTGMFRNFVTKGTIETNLGTVETNVDMKIPAGGPSVYNGVITTDSFQLGPFLDNDALGRLDFQGKINGTGLKTGTLSAALDGMVNSLEFNGYTYQHIQVNGSVAKKKFNGELIASDPNLDAHLNGLIDFSQQQPIFNFEAEVAKANLTKLRFANQQVEFDGKFKCNFTGDDVDNFLGHASIYDASLFKNGNRVSFDSLTLESSIEGANKKIVVVSNEFDGAIAGEFSIKDLPASFQTFLNKYYPSYIKPAKTMPANQNFTFVISTKKVDEYIDLFEKDLKGFNNSVVAGRIDTRDKHLLDLTADIPSWGYKNIVFNNLLLKGTGNLDSLSLATTIGDVILSDSLHFPGTTIHLRSSNDLSSLQVKTSANQTLNSANISAQVHTERTGVKLVFDPSTFEINSKIWIIDKDGELAYTNNVLAADGMNIHSGEQSIAITTHPSGEGNWNDIHIDLKKINMGDFTPYVVKSERLEGVLTGSTDITNPFGNHIVRFQGQAEQFRFDNDSIGRLDLAADYQKSTGAVKATLHSDNKDYHFDAKALINTTDSTAAPIDITTDVAAVKVNMLEKYLGGIFTNFTGNASGKLQVTGTPAHLYYLGTVALKDASLKVAYTQCTYKIAAATIRFKKDTIDFGTIQIKDKFGHTADLLHGRLMHHAFDDLGFDFELNTNRMLLLDTKATDNSQFYGTVVGKARMTLIGPEQNMLMNIKGEPTDSSNIYLPPSFNREGGEADFIEWRVFGKEMKKGLADRKSANLVVNLDMYANNYANIYMILDPLSGDIIKANGHGNLVMRVGTTEDLTMNGRYEIDRGNYNFTFQSFIHKPFILSEGVGNYIQWNGNPYDATIGIAAAFRAENVRFSDLGLNNSVGIQDENVRRYRGDIIVTANLKGKLMSPNIAFTIDLPPGSPLRNDQDAQTLLARIQNDPNELNKQVSCLVVLNSFVPLSSSTNTFDASSAVGNVVVNSISGAVSNAFSKLASQRLQTIFKDKSIRVNFNTNFYNGNYLVYYNPDESGLNYNRTNLNFSVAKNFMNEKLTLTVGSALDFGMTAQQTAASSFQFLPDINAEYKITPDGRVALTFFYRDSYNYLSTGNHTQNSSGTSISYRREFDRIDELFKKKKKKTPPPPPPPPPAPDSKTDSN